MGEADGHAEGAGRPRAFEARLARGERGLRCIKTRGSCPWVISWRETKRIASTHLRETPTERQTLVVPICFLQRTLLRHSYLRTLNRPVAKGIMLANIKAGSLLSLALLLR